MFLVFLFCFVFFGLGANHLFILLVGTALIWLLAAIHPVEGILLQIPRTCPRRNQTVCGMQGNLPELLESIKNWKTAKVETPLLPPPSLAPACVGLFWIIDFRSKIGTWESTLGSR